VTLYSEERRRVGEWEEGRGRKEGGEEGVERGEETPFVYKQYSRRTHASSTRNEHSFFFL